MEAQTRQLYQTTRKGLRMREIEFRGKTLKGGEWKYGDLIKTNGATGDGWAIQYYDPESGWMVEDVQERTIGQFTGLVDSMNRRIYEGDVISPSTSRWKVQSIRKRTEVYAYKDSR